MKMVGSLQAEAASVSMTVGVCVGGLRVAASSGGSPASSQP